MTAIPAVRLADHAAAMRETFTLPPGRTHCGWRNAVGSAPLHYTRNIETGGGYCGAFGVPE